MDDDNKWQRYHLKSSSFETKELIKPQTEIWRWSDWLRNTVFVANAMLPGATDLRPRWVYLILAHVITVQLPKRQQLRGSHFYTVVVPSIQDADVYNSGWDAVCHISPSFAIQRSRKREREGGRNTRMLGVSPWTCTGRLDESHDTLHRHYGAERLIEVTVVTTSISSRMYISFSLTHSLTDRIIQGPENAAHISLCLFSHHARNPCTVTRNTALG